jgi:translation elongation factor EF-1alpha
VQANECAGRVFTVEMHHKQMAEAGPGSNIGMSVRGLPKSNMPRVGDVMVLCADTSLAPVKSFVAQVKAGELCHHAVVLLLWALSVPMERTSKSRGLWVLSNETVESTALVTMYLALETLWKWRCLFRVADSC